MASATASWAGPPPKSPKATNPLRTGPAGRSTVVGAAEVAA
jgi:hypothetical protein